MQTFINIIILINCNKHVDKAKEILSDITYRLFEEKDIEGIIRLWKEESGWGGISLDQFKKWFINTPYGDCIIIVAADENDEVIGQIIFTPSLVYIRNTEIKSLRVAAPILRNDLRFEGADFQDHPISKMFIYGISIAAQRNFALAYIFPARGWLRAIKSVSNSHIHWQTATFNGFSISLDSPFLKNSGKDENVVLAVASGFNHEYDELWDVAKNLLPINCGIVRKREWLEYRLSSHLTIEARSITNGNLLGYCTIKKNSGLLVDMLARNKNEMERTLTGAIRMLHYLNPYRIPVQFHKVTGMHTPLISEIATNLCLEPLDYKFDFGCCVLNQFLNFEYVKPTEWYMMPDV